MANFWAVGFCVLKNIYFHVWLDTEDEEDIIANRIARCRYCKSQKFSQIGKKKFNEIDKLN